MKYLFHFFFYLVNITEYRGEKKRIGKRNVGRRREVLKMKKMGSISQH